MSPAFSPPLRGEQEVQGSSRGPHESHGPGSVPPRPNQLGDTGSAVVSQGDTEPSGAAQSPHSREERELDEWIGGPGGTSSGLPTGSNPSRPSGPADTTR